MNMRIPVLLSVLAVLWGATVVFGASSQAAEQTSADAGTTGTPVVVMTGLTYEFTPVVDGTEITHDFPIKNTGNGPLAIERVRTG